MKLLDVNVWLAAVWGRHVHHRRAKQDDVDRGLTRPTACGTARMAGCLTASGTASIDLTNEVIREVIRLDRH